jgi:hypothetical protein
MKIICFGLILMLLPFVMAVDVDVGINSGGEDVDLGVGINSEGGNVDVTIDGVGWSNELNSLHQSIAGGFDAYTMAIYIRRVTNIIKGIDEGTDVDRQMAYDLSTTFLTMKYLDYIRYNSFRLDIIETFLMKQYPKEYCDTVKEFVKKNGFKMLRCGNATIIKTSYGTLTVEDFPEELKEEIKIEKTNITQVNNAIFKEHILQQFKFYIQKCVEGRIYFCRLAENLKKSYPDFIFK